MHIRFIYSQCFGHKVHHQLVKPTSHESGENFTFVDGSTHIIVYFLNYLILKRIMFFDDFLFVLTYSQWVIVGQLQHGGKDVVELDSIPFLEYTRRRFVKESLCVLHDRHHTLFNKNYSMTGIPDRIFGTKS
jgi:sterol desaturase/sphingolipid hydroxylase (fatty acid hydroxylase superfamily)